MQEQGEEMEMQEIKEEEEEEMDRLADHYAAFATLSDHCATTHKQQCRLCYPHLVDHYPATFK